MTNKTNFNFAETTLAGRVGGDAEVKSLGDNKTVTNFSVAVTESWLNKTTNEWDSHTEWYRVVRYGTTASGKWSEENLKKGALVFLKGRNRTNKFQDKNTGEDRYSTDLVATSVDKILDPISDADTASSGATAAPAPTPAPAPAGTVDPFAGIDSVQQ